MTTIVNATEAHIDGFFMLGEDTGQSPSCCVWSTHSFEDWTYYPSLDHETLEAISVAECAEGCLDTPGCSGIDVRHVEGVNASEQHSDY